MFDIAIVGASIAGSSLAIKLRRQNLKIALIDKSIFPRAKACGEGLSLYGYSHLEGLGLRDRLLELPKKALYGYTIRHGDHSITIGDKNEDAAPLLYGVSRLGLDKLLLDTAAEKKDVELFLGTRVERAVYDSSGWKIFLGEAATPLRARYLTIAAGNNSGFLDDVAISLPRSRRRFGLSFHLEGNFFRPCDTVQIFVKRGFEIYCTPLSERMLGVAILADKNSPRFNTAELIHQIVKEVSEILSFQGEQVSTPCGSTPFERRANLSPALPALLIGDAVETMDPIGGMGMTHALLSSSLAAEAFVEAFATGRHEKVFADYYRLRDRRARGLRSFTSAVFYLLRSKYGRGALKMVESLNAGGILMNQHLVRLGMIVFALGFASCSLAAPVQCRYWQNRGEIMGTIESCKQCVATLGVGNLEAVRGCSLGLDAASLMQPPPTAPQTPLQPPQTPES